MTTGVVPVKGVPHISGQGTVGTIAGIWLKIDYFFRKSRQMKVAFRKFDRCLGFEGDSSCQRHGSGMFSQSISM